ncbi:MAG: hypothetical protein IJ511_03260 [Bacteroides sp.]|nr:hypothetical protein [Bacteroides sp.]
MKEENEILRKVGTENPFRVPEGYFEQLTTDVMARLPEKTATDFPQERLTLWTKMKPWVYMAAMFAGAALLIRVGSMHMASPQLAAAEEAEAETETEYISTVVDNSMLDDYALYVYLTDATEIE